MVEIQASFFILVYLSLSFDGWITISAGEIHDIWLTVSDR